MNQVKLVLADAVASGVKLTHLNLEFAPLIVGQKKPAGNNWLVCRRWLAATTSSVHHLEVDLQCGCRTVTRSQVSVWVYPCETWHDGSLSCHTTGVRCAEKPEVADEGVGNGGEGANDECQPGPIHTAADESGAERLVVRIRRFENGW